MSVCVAVCTGKLEGRCGLSAVAELPKPFRTKFQSVSDNKIWRSQDSRRDSFRDYSHDSENLQFEALAATLDEVLSVA